MRKKLTRAANIRTYLKNSPDANLSAVAKLFGVTYQSVYTQKRKLDGNPIRPPKRAQWKLLAVQTTDQPTATVTVTPPATDMVNHPTHYKTGGIETIDFIEAKKLDYHLGNVVKYITRADHKGNQLQDLQKARWYLDRAIEKRTA